MAFRGPVFADRYRTAVADAIVTAVLAFQDGSARDDIAVVVLKAAPGSPPS